MYTNVNLFYFQDLEERVADEQVFVLCKIIEFVYLYCIRFLSSF